MDQVQEEFPYTVTVMDQIPEATTETYSVCVQVQKQVNVCKTTMVPQTFEVPMYNGCGIASSGCGATSAAASVGSGCGSSSNGG